MKVPLLYITLLYTLAACNKPAAVAPVWLNKTAMVSLPEDSLVFKAAGTNWKAALHSFTQPLPLRMTRTPDGFVLTVKNRYGVAEGPAQLILSKAGQQFYYPVQLRNNSFGTVTDKDYRSPKTVNPDSALQQQRMIHRMDEWRNLLFLQHRLAYFFEERLTLDPTAGTFLAQKEKPISASYVQPGSAVAIPVKSTYERGGNSYTATAGPLTDRYGNTVANGTLVTFIYGSGAKTWGMTAALLNGYVTVNIPADTSEAMWLNARVHEVISATIQLNHK